MTRTLCGISGALVAMAVRDFSFFGFTARSAGRLRDPGSTTSTSFGRSGFS